MIRRAKKEDVQAISLIGKIAYTSGYENVLGKETAQLIAEKRYNEESIQEWMNEIGVNMYVFETSVIEGFASIRKVGNIIHIDDLAVFPSKQRSGIGNQFIQYFSNRFTSVDTLLLDVENGNSAGVKFFEELGFSQNSCSPAMVENIPVKLLHMELKTR